MEKNRINISLSRQNFRILTDESPDYIRQLESAVNKRIRAAQRQYPELSMVRCTLLAMFSMEDELQKTRNDMLELEEKLTRLRELPLQGTTASAQQEREQRVEEKSAEPAYRRFNQPVGV